MQVDRSSVATCDLPSGFLGQRELPPRLGFSILRGLTHHEFPPEHLKRIRQLYRWACFFGGTAIALHALAWLPLSVTAAHVFLLQSFVAFAVLGFLTFKPEQTVPALRLGFIVFAVLLLVFVLNESRTLGRGTGSVTAESVVNTSLFHLALCFVAAQTLFSPRSAWCVQLVILTTMAAGILGIGIAAADTADWIPGLRFIAAGGAALALTSVSSDLFTLQARIEADRVRLRSVAFTDSLTGLPNRRAFDKLLAEESVRAEKAGVPLSVVALDIDHFKSVNDLFGHDTGDQVLKTLAGTLQSNVRTSDLVTRWGGEEFMVVLPTAQLTQAATVAERIRSAMESTDTAVGVVTVSLGVACLGAGEEPGEMIKRADRALYRAKAKGRNRVEILPVSVSSGKFDQ